MRYEERIIDEIQSLNDIVEVISNYVPLKRSGRTFKALCPFHQEKTPSFTVHPEKQIFHCFGCSAGGNVFSFLMKFENLTFPEALRNLAARVNVSLPEPARRGTPEEISESEALYEAYGLAQHYYAANLKHPEKGGRAQEYLRERGFSEEILSEFPLGWASPDWRGLFEFLSRKGVKDTVLYRSGLILRSREGNPYDLFRGRLLFPISNLQGKVIAFGGRGLADETPKYLNSPESPIFRKRRELYGLHLTKRLITQEGRVLIVEGYFDFLRVYTSGFRNVVATLGTALSEDHVRVLKRFAPEAVVVFDGDQAGEAASLRGLEAFLEGEMSVKVVALPSGKDPDTLIKEKGPEAFQKLLQEADDFFDFKWQSLTRRFNPQDSTGLLKISSDLLETLSKVRSPILLDRYLKRLSRLLGVGEDSLRNELAKLQKKGQVQRAASSLPAAAIAPSPEYPEETILISLLLEEPSFWQKWAKGLSAADFKGTGSREAFQILKESHEAGTSVAYHRVLNRLGDESMKKSIVAHSLKELSVMEREKAFLDCYRKIRQRRTNERLEKLRRAITEAEGGGEKEKVTELLHEYRTLLTQKEA